MLLERYYDDTLAQASYLIGCEQTREAIIIDPNRDAHAYVVAAAARRMRIRYVTETHIHADFLSGSRELAREARAKLLLSGHGGADWSYGYAADANAQLLRDGDTLMVGKVRLHVWHTPGHTPEHLAFLITDTAIGDRPMGMVTGDFLFVGDVGRPDLLEKAAKIAGSMETAARQLFQSLRRLSSLPDYLQIWPGHGAGSACGKALGAVPQSTLGYERLYNPALQHATEEAFVAWVLADQPEPPPYFAEMKRRNRDGDLEWRGGDGNSWMTAKDLESAIADKVQVIDVRSATDFARNHLPGTINIPESKSFTTYAGTVLRYDRPIVMMVKSPDQALRIRRQLAMIGMDLVGWSSVELMNELKHHVRPLPLIEAGALSERIAANGSVALRVIDVRGRSEWNHGHLPKATHIYLGDLAADLVELNRDEPIVVHCQTGTRSSIAASLLTARGFTNVTNFAGGVDAWQKAGLPLIDDA